MTPPLSPKLGPPLLADGHVHFYPGYDQRLFFDSAAANFADAIPAAPGCLLFTESAGADAFGQFRRGVGTPHEGGWEFQLTAEDNSLLALRPETPPIILVAGRQIITRERLEVLALGRHQPYPDGNSAEQVIDDIAASGALPVLPWALGKWWFGRGRIVRALLNSAIADRLWLGDNSGRPAFAPDSPLFALARRRQVPILPGTDPLPMNGQATRAGRYGFVLNAELRTTHPASDLLAALRTRTQPPTFGRRASPREFVAERLTD